MIRRSRQFFEDVGGINVALDTWACTHMTIIERILSQLVQCGKSLESMSVKLEPGAKKRAHHIYCEQVHVATLISRCETTINRGIRLITQIKTYPDGKPSGWPTIYAEL